MTTKGGYFQKWSGWMLVCLALVLAAAPATAFDLPDFKSLNLPSFKYGKLERDRDVNEMFQTYNVPSDYRYYITGQGKIPNAIIGVQNQFKLRPGLWQAVNLTKPLLRSWVSQMDNIYGYPPYGSIILDNNDNRIGIWYSSKQWTTVIIEESGQIAILTPEAPGFRGGH